MSGIRFFNSGRDLSKRGPAAEQMRFEMEKKGKLPSTERYKRIMQKKLEEHRQKAMMGKGNSPFSLPGSMKHERVLSKRAEQTLKEISARKARKEAQAMRKMVVIQPRTYHNGQVTRKGQIYDVAGNVVGEINSKNGKMTTYTGMPLGRYKPKSLMTDLTIQEGINKYSPYFIKMRQMQMLQHQGVDSVNVHGSMLPDVINVWGNASHEGQDGQSRGFAMARQNVGMTAWGAMSDNVLGTFTDNTWGTMADNVWGGTNNNIWGGIGDSGSLWSWRGFHVWGTGSGRNYLKSVTSFITAFFGLSNKSNKDRLRAFRMAARSSTSSSARSAPTAPRGR